MDQNKQKKQKQQKTQINGYTDKELAAIIDKEKHRLKRLRRQMQDIQADINATYRAINMWAAMRSILNSVKGREDES